MIYYVIVVGAVDMRVFVPRGAAAALLEGLQWLLDPSVQVKVARQIGDFAGAQPSGRAGPVKKLYDAGGGAHCGEQRTQGAWYHQWRLVSLDGSTFDVADTAVNNRGLRSAGRQPGIECLSQNSFCGFAGEGTHVLWAACMGKYKTDEIQLATAVVTALRKGMLCLADRFFPGYQLWQKAARRPAPTCCGESGQAMHAWK